MPSERSIYLEIFKKILLCSLQPKPRDYLTKFVYVNINDTQSKYFRPIAGCAKLTY